MYFGISKTWDYVEFMDLIFWDSKLVFFDLKKEEEESMKIKCRKDYSKREELEKKELRSCSIPLTRQ